MEVSAVPGSVDVEEVEYAVGHVGVLVQLGARILRYSNHYYLA